MFYMALLKKIYMYFIFWLHSIFIAEHGPSLVAVSGGDALMVVQASLIVVASLTEKHRLSVHRLQ